MMTFVLDTNVVAEALRNPGGPAGDYLRGARRLELRLAANVGLALEYEAICADGASAHGLSAQEAKAFANGLIAMMEPVKSNRLYHPRLRDPTDEMVLEAAVSGQADAIVTFNPKDFQVASDRFGIQVLTPGK
jgi:predicted nucleic acid-binding protein